MTRCHVYDALQQISTLIADEDSTFSVTAMKDYFFLGSFLIVQ